VGNDPLSRHSSLARMPVPVVWGVAGGVVVVVGWVIVGPALARR
jgi:hypothetical protein